MASRPDTTFPYIFTLFVPLLLTSGFLLGLLLMQHNTIMNLNEQLQSNRSRGDLWYKYWSEASQELKVEKNRTVKLEQLLITAEVNYNNYMNQATTKIESLKEKIENATFLQEFANEHNLRVKYWHNRTTKCEEKETQAQNCETLMEKGVDIRKLYDTYIEGNLKNCKAQVEELRDIKKNITNTIKPQQIYKDCKEYISDEPLCRSTEYAMRILNVYWSF